MIRYISRRITALLLIFIISLATGCGSDSPRRYTTDILGSFDTVITIIAYCQNDSDFQRLKEYATERYYELHQLYDIYNSYPETNNARTINEKAGISPVTVSKELLDLVKASRDWYHDSPGVVNIAMGPVLSLWHDARTLGLADPEMARLPEMAALQAASAYTDLDLIEIDEAGSTVFLPDENMKLDLGAVAKGYATELVTAELIEMGYDSFIISSGGNIRAAGRPLEESRSKWGIGIQDPMISESSNSILDTVYVNDLSVVTSGNYQRYYIVDGEKYHHIIDPRTLLPGEYHKSVTVSAVDSGLADYLSTTLFLLPYDEGRAYIETIAGTDALWVLSSGEIKATEGMLKMLKKLGGAENPPFAP